MNPEMKIEKKETWIILPFWLILLIFAIMIGAFIVAYKNKPTTYVVPKYIAITLKPNSTKCLPAKMLTLYHEMLRPEEVITVVGDAKNLHIGFDNITDPKVVCLKNKGNSTIIVYWVSSAYSDIFKDCKVWLAHHVGNNVYYTCSQRLMDNRTIYGDCYEACGMYFNGTDRKNCAVACQQSIFVRYGKK